ncbi:MULTISPECIES: L-aspartate oxidase [Halomonadaceae]|uniref:L-aspartate oxidase n=1 Tax=Halomonadaceae TaxID=28256 RepID=UPI0015991E1F|nr:MULTISPECIES: L-aspartate oxidase [Halomonas]QJQ94625.1 L-aspartate oxidase [Halomonas sp. PA5]
MHQSEHDVVIIGGGVAGLTLALEVAGARRVTLLRPDADDHGASQWAQGGIAAVLSPQDDIEAHVHDTLVAGDGLCDEAAVRFTVTQGPGAIDWLLAKGMAFTRDESANPSYPYHLTREGGHGARRVIHAADATGRALIDTLLAHAEGHPGITLRRDISASALLSDVAGHCRGIQGIDAQGAMRLLYASDVVLATGGASGLYRHTTSPLPACGEGMLMAAELGAELANLEFQQFHPTCLFDPDGPPFLISEAIRGEGGILRNLQGQRFMPDIDERGELAPRDIVARAIDAQMQRAGDEHVWLDISHLPAATIQRLFPTIHAHCQSRGLDITRQPIPVVPAAHYSCGGIVTDLSGASQVPHLYAIGEVACTGLHGANRMASNSLLECLVFARAAARALRKPRPTSDATITPRRIVQGGAAAPEYVDALMNEVRQLMSQKVGIVRHDAGIAEALRELTRLAIECRHLYRHHQPTLQLTSLHHAVRLAIMSVRTASERRESRGLHYNLDCPERLQSERHVSRASLAPELS